MSEQALTDEEKQKIEEEERIRAEAQQKYKKQNDGESSFVVALLLCLFLGTFGFHRFYVGKIGTGVVMLLLTLTLVGAIISAPWALIDLILIITKNFQDRDGNYITE